MIKGFRFTNQLANAEVDARIHQEFLNKNDGIFYGMELSKTTNSITISEGLCEIAGRPVAVVDSETIAVGTDSLYCVLVLEIDLSKESTKDTFSQVSFKLLTSSIGYSNVTQQDINKYAGSDNLYQLEFARFKTGTNGITDFKDTRKFLNFDSIYNEIRKEIQNIEDGSIYVLKSDEAILFESENEEGTVEDITLNDTVANYKKIEIEYRYENLWNISAVYNPNGKKLTLSLDFKIDLNYKSVRHIFKNVRVLDNTIKIAETGFSEITLDSTVGADLTENNIAITRVIGYKK